MNWTMVMVRGLAPLAGLAVVTLAVQWGVTSITGALPGVESQLSFPTWFRWAWLVVLLAALGQFYWRLYAWQSDRTHPCERCGGPLGWRRDGKVWFGRQLPDYRKCLACGKPNGER